MTTVDAAREALVEAVRAVLQPDEPIDLPDEEWEPVMLRMRDALAAVDAAQDIEDAAANPWLDRLVAAERRNHCGDAACMTRRVSAAIRVLTGWKEHQDYCWAIEAFEVELGIAGADR